MNDDATKDLIFGVFEASLAAQLRAVRRLRQARLRHFAAQSDYNSMIRQEAAGLNVET